MTAKQEKALQAAREILTDGGRREFAVEAVTESYGLILVTVTTQDRNAAWADKVFSQHIYNFVIGANGGYFKWTGLIKHRYFKLRDIECTRIS